MKNKTVKKMVTVEQDYISIVLFFLLSFCIFSNPIVSNQTHEQMMKNENQTSSNP